MPLDDALGSSSTLGPEGRRRAAASVMVGCLALTWLAVPSCGSSGTTGDGGAGGAAGTVGAGGIGGAVPSGGTGGGGQSGGGGGASAGGSAGSLATGGSSAAGGAPANGGASASGGAGGGGAGASGGAASGGSGAIGGGAGGAGGGPGGGGQPGGSGGGGSSGGASGFTLTSPVLTEGGVYPAANTCAGADVSPELDWTAGPAAAKSYALVLTDTTINLVHWVVWDIPIATSSLPAMLAATPNLTTPAGAHQIALSGTGYTGPCPSGNLHVYELDLHAVDVATLPGVPANATTAELKALVTTHSLGKASLSAQSSAKRP